MKLRFIENLLRGVKVELMFFRMKEQEDAQEYKDYFLTEHTDLECMYIDIPELIESFYF